MGLKVNFSRAQTRILNRLAMTKGADVASAAAPTLGSDGNFFDITGTTTITHLNPTNWAAGSRITLQFDGAVTVTHNNGTDTSTAASLLLRGARNWTTAAGDRLELIYNGTNWLETNRTLVGQQIFTNTRFGFAKGADVASAATLTLGSDGNVFTLTGTTAIDYITTTGWAAGSIVILLFGTSITLNHATGSVPANTAALSLTGAANVSATDKDVVTLIYDGTVWRSMHAISAI